MRISLIRRLRKVALLIALVGCGGLRADFLHSGGGPYDYNADANWESGLIDHRFLKTQTATPLTVTVGQDTTAANLTLAYGGSANGAFNLNTSGGNRTLKLTGGISVNLTAPGTKNVNLGASADGQRLTVELQDDAEFHVNSSSVVNVHYVVTGNRTMRKTGPGKMAIGNATASVFAGVEIEEGILNLRAGSYPVTLGDATPGNTKSATLRIVNTDANSHPVTVAPGSSGTLEIASGDSNNRVESRGTITLANDVVLRSHANGGVGNTLTLAGKITGTGNVATAGNKATILSGSVSNDYVGTTTVQELELRLQKSGGAVAIPGALVVGDGSGSDLLTYLASRQVADTAAVTVRDGATLALNGFDDGYDSLTVEAGGVLSTADAGGTVSGKLEVNYLTIHGTKFRAGTYAASSGTVNGVDLQAVILGTGTITVAQLVSPATLITVR